MSNLFSIIDKRAIREAAANTKLPEMRGWHETKLVI